MTRISMKTTITRAVFAASGIALALVLVPPAFTQNEAPPVENPCRGEVEGKQCIQAALTNPPGGTVIRIGDPQTTVTLQGVAERGSMTYLYILRASNKQLLTDEPMEVVAGDDGVFRHRFAANQLGEGRYVAAVYYQASLKDPGEDETFLQATGNPMLEFTLDSIVPTGGGCDRQCSDFGQEVKLGFDAGDATLFMNRQNNFFFWLTEEGAGSGSVANDELRAEAITELGNRLCKFPSGAAEDLLNNLNLTQANMDFRGVMPFADLIEAISTSDCEEPNPNFWPTDDWFPMFREPVNRMQCSIEDVCYNMITITSSDPLIALEGTEAQRVSIAVGVDAGRVTLTIPPMENGQWSLDVHPSATTAPRMYHVARDTPPAAAAEGWVVPRAELETSLAQLLLARGYPSKEVAAFVEHEARGVLWDAEAVAIHPIARETMDAAVPLTVVPAPETSTRIAFLLRPVIAGTILETPAADSIPPAPEVGSLTLREYAVFVR